MKILLSIAFVLCYSFTFSQIKEAKPLFSATHTVDTVAIPDYYIFYVTITSYWSETPKTKKSKFTEITLDSTRKILNHVLKSNNINTDSLKLNHIDNGNAQSYLKENKLHETYTFLIFNKEDVIKINNLLTIKGVTNTSAYPKFSKSVNEIKEALLKKAYEKAKDRATQYAKENNVSLGKIHSANEFIGYNDLEINNQVWTTYDKNFIQIEPKPFTLTLVISYEIN